MLLALCNCQPFLSPPLSLPSSFGSPLLSILHFHHPITPRNLLLLRSSAFDSETLPQSAIQRISEKLRSLGYVEEEDKEDAPLERLRAGCESNSPGEIFVPLPNQLPKYRVGDTLDSSWSTPENPVPKPGSGKAITRFHELRREAWAEKRNERAKSKVEGRENAPTLAELKLPAEELRRLRGLGIGLKKKIKIGKAGITEGIVNGIHERWRRAELVKIVCEDLCRLNMKRTHDLLERKTGGLVVWRSGSKIILYRGADYRYPYFDNGDVTSDETSDGASLDVKMDSEISGKKEKLPFGTNGQISVTCSESNKTAQFPLIRGVGSPNRVRFQLPGEAQLAEEADKLLEGLGPRFEDWYGYGPQPVDADLLPAVVRGFRKPFRLLPYGVKPKLTNDDMTTLRRLGRPLPCHFALGRNRKLHGLAALILKLWEKCEIAKIAVKRGVQNTNSELMAEELKLLTGGTVLSRDKEYIVLYRGKDFLPASVSLAIEQRRNQALQVVESRTTFSLSDAQENQCGKMECSSEAELCSEQRAMKSHEAAISRTNAKLAQAIVKKERAEKLLAGLEKEEIRKGPEIDKEGITEEERYMLRKVGLRMKPFLLLGRRGVFDGTVENMHLHWKYRELVKILSGEKRIEEVHTIAQTLEAESGGILVAIERVSKGYAIIVYRGKNYERPASLRPPTLLSKREALKRYTEAQRRKSLKLHVLKLSRHVGDLKLKLAKDKDIVSNQFDGDVKIQFAKEMEMNDCKSLDYADPKTDHGTCLPNLASDPKNVQARDYCESDSTSCTNDHLDSWTRSLKIRQKDVQREFAVDNEGRDIDQFVRTESESNDLGNCAQTSQQDELCTTSENKGWGVLDIAESNVMSESVEATDLVEIDTGSDAEFTKDSSTCIDNVELQYGISCSGTRNAEPYMSRTKNDMPDTDRPRESDLYGIPFRAARLTNKERLLLRKQALKMKKRPVLAVGKSNILTGVAKTIKTHFQKHPLAIVNIKGRAKGTSVQEVVSKLEEATGAVLVSREPSKIILYRGWGAGEERSQTKNNNASDLGIASAGGEGWGKPVISPELVAAIRLECGLQSHPDPDCASLGSTTWPV